VHCTDATRWTKVGGTTLDREAAGVNGRYSVQQPVLDLDALIADGAVVVTMGKTTSCDADGGSVRQAYANGRPFRDGRMAGLQAILV